MSENSKKLSKCKVYDLKTGKCLYEIPSIEEFPTPETLILKIVDDKVEMCQLSDNKKETCIKANITKDELEKMYLADRLYISQIAEKSGLSEEEVREFTNLYKIPSKEELEKLYIKDELSMREVAKKLERNLEQVREYMDLYGIKRRESGGRVGKIPSKEELEKLYIKDEMSMENIARTFHTSPSKLYEYMDLYGIKRREKRVETRNR